MFSRFIGRSRTSLPTHHPPSLERSTLGSRNPSHVSIQHVSWTGEDMVGLAGWDGDLSNSRIGQRFYDGKPLRRTPSQSVAPSKKTHAAYFTRQSKLPHWVKEKASWVQSVCDALRRARHPDWWKAHQKYLRRREDRSDCMTNDHDDSHGAFTHVPPPSSYANTAIYPTINETNMQQDARRRELASKQSEPSVTSKRQRPPPKYGKLQKDKEASQRDLITTIGSFFSRVTTRVMDPIRRRAFASEGRPIGGRLRKGRRSIIEDCDNVTNTLVVQPSTTVHSPKEVSSPSKLVTEQDTGLHDSTPARVPVRLTSKLTKKRSSATASPASSIHLTDLPDTLNKKTVSRSSHHSIHSHLSSLRRNTPSPDTTPLSRPYSQSSHTTSAPQIPKIDMEFPIGLDDWGPLGPASEAGDSCISGTTLVGGEEGSVLSACGYRTNLRQHPLSSVTGLQRGDSGVSMGSQMTAASIEDRSADEDTSEKSPRFYLTTHDPTSVIPAENFYPHLSRFFWEKYDRGVDAQYEQPPCDRTTATDYHHFSQPRRSRDSEWVNHQSEVMV